MITKKRILEILKNNELRTFGVITESRYESIANDIMGEIIKTVTPKKECLTDLSRDGKHTPIISDDGVYCGLCGLDLECNIIE